MISHGICGIYSQQPDILVCLEIGSTKVKQGIWTKQNWCPMGLYLETIGHPGNRSLAWDWICFFLGSFGVYLIWMDGIHLISVGNHNQRIVNGMKTHFRDFLCADFHLPGMPVQSNHSNPLQAMGLPLDPHFSYIHIQWNHSKIKWKTKMKSL